MKKQLFIFTTTILSLTATAQIPNYVPTNGLVGWWPFNGNANDESGNGNNGTVNGATLTADRFGNVNKAYSFDAVNDQIIVTAQSTIAAQSDYSVSFWFNSPTSTFNGAFISLDTWFCKLGHDNPGLFYKDEIGNQANNWYVQTHFLTEPVINTWHHLVLKKNSTNVDLFLDTSYVGSITTYGFSNFNPSSLIQFGYYCCQEYFNGYLDDFGIWNRILTDCEIHQLYTASLPSSTQTQTDLDSYTWPVNGQTYTQSGIYSDTLINAAGCDSIVALDLTLSFTGIDEINSNSTKKLLKITDLNGKETPIKKNTVLLFIYEDGTVERVYEVE